MFDYLSGAKAQENQIIEDRRHLHQNPEVGDTLPLTYAFVTKRLQEMGYKTRRCARYGVVCEVGRPGKTILLRADMDALPMPEESGLPFASPYPDRAHMCGHDTHTAMLLGAARLLKESEAALDGTVRIAFQPNEEGLFGACDMIADGLLDGVDAALAIHIDSTMPLGLLMPGIGYSFASNDFFDITVHGKGGHAARPSEAIDPINTAAHIQLGIQTLISREATSTETNVLSITSVEAGGQAYNIIPDFAVMRGTLRTYNDAQRTLLKKRLVEMAESMAGAFGAEAKVEFHGDGIPAVFCNEALAAEFCSYVDEMLGDGYVSKIPFHKVGSEDFAFIAEGVPSGYFFLGAGPDEKSGWPYGQHNPKVQHNESVFYKGTAVLAQCAARWLTEH